MTKLFVPDQRLFRLKLTGNDRETARECLTCAHLPDDDQALEEQSGSPREAHQSRWEQVTNRLDYLAHLGPAVTVPEDGQRGCRLCITSLAGVGKSICLQQLAFVRQQRVRGQVVLRLQFAGLPTKADKLWRMLVDMVQDVLREKITHQRLKGKDLLKWLKDLAGIGRLTLVVDALDEDLVVVRGDAEADDAGAPKAKALRMFLQRYPRVHCAVAGRPYAVTQDYWAELFARTPSARCNASDWEFCLSEVFTPAQAELSLGESRLSQLARLPLDGKLNPRTLDVLRTLRADVILTVQSLADVYWHGFYRAIGESNRTESGQPRKTGLTIHEIIDLLGALAMTCVQRGVVEIRLGMESIRAELDERAERAVNGGRSHSNPCNAPEKLQQLLKAGEQFVEISSIIDPSDGHVRWVNATQRDFFAALWLLRRGNSQELQWLMDRPSRVLKTRSSGEWAVHTSRSQHAAQHDLWCFVCGMPDAAFENQDPAAERWRTLIRTIFTRPVDRPRPTELMAVSWPNLLRRAGYLNTATWNDSQLQVATRMAQVEADEWVKEKASMPKESSTAKEIALEFLSEYPRLRDGEGKLICKEDLESQWKSCESFKGKEFFACDYGKKEKLTRSFRLCAIPVTRRLYALFDAYHEQDFGSYDHLSPSPRCPAIYLSYWDALMVSIWLHGGLLDEWEWEYACRGGASDSEDKQPMWWWGNDKTRLEEHAWIRSNSEGRTQVVGQKTANAYGLYDMLGNVWEWTSSFGSEKGNSRVMRGGRFCTDPKDVRCSDRGVDNPSFSFFHTGCRVARADF